MPWRSDVFYEGGLDPVVAAKALLVCLAIAMAWLARVQQDESLPLGNFFIWALLAYLTVTTFGAYTIGNLSVTAILAIRILMLAVAVILVVKASPTERVIEDLVAAMLLVALITVITGATSAAGGQRLHGGIPPVHPNDVAFICAIPAIGLIRRVLLGNATKVHVFLIVFLMASIWASGSRTSLMATIAASLVMLIQARKLKPAVVFVLACGLPAIVYITVGTSMFSQFFTRDTDQNSSSVFGARGIAWGAALDYPATVWNLIFGSGLSVKQVPVEGQYWDFQVLDSSWVSAFVHGGIVAVVILVVWILVAVAKSFRMPRENRMFIQAILLLVVIRSVTENGMVDSGSMFLVFLIISLLTDRKQRKILTRWVPTRSPQRRDSLVPAQPSAPGSRSE